MELDTSRHCRKGEPQASPSSHGLFQTFLSLPADSIKSHLSSVLFYKGCIIFLVSVHHLTSLLVRKSDLHFLHNRKPLYFRRVLLEEVMHTSTWWGS